eukprot:1029742-Lingulodinium_polyedra.AAC.1
MQIIATADRRSIIDAPCLTAFACVTAMPVRGICAQGKPCFPAGTLSRQALQVFSSGRARRQKGEKKTMAVAGYDEQPVSFQGCAPFVMDDE